MCANCVQMKKRNDDEELPERFSFDAYSEWKVTGAIFFDTRRSLPNEKYPLKFRVTYNRKHKYFDTGYSLSIKEWNSLPKTQSKQLKETRGTLTDLHAIIKQHIKDLVKANNFSLKILKERIKAGDNKSINIAFAVKIKRLEENGQVGTAGIYDSALKSLSEYNKQKEIRYSTASPDWLQKYERWFVGDETNSYATVSIYLRCLRAIFNEAISSGIIPAALYPFGKGKYEIPSSPGRKMALSLPQIKILLDYQTEPGSTTEKMRDLWFFLYLANGMNVKDMILLRWKHIADGEIVYLREKTKKTSKNKEPIIVPVMKEMETIFDKWANTDKSPDAYIFGYLKKKKNSPERIRVVTQNVTRLINKHLKKIAEATGLPPISTYTARHSFSTVLLRSGANVEFISEALGHSSIETTKAYLAGFETEARRKMNEKLLNFEADEKRH